MDHPSDWLTPILLTYLCDRAGSWIRRAEIDQSLGTDDWCDALTELIDEQGYKILTVRADGSATPSLINLIDRVPATVFPADMDYSLRNRLAKPGKLLCKICGRIAGDPHPYFEGGKIRLFARFKLPPENGRGQVRDNVEALCSICQESLQRLHEAKPSLADLQRQIGQADEAVRHALCDWLLEEHCSARNPSLYADREYSDS